jgi:hypothetical protein
MIAASNAAHAFGLGDIVDAGAAVVEDGASAVVDEATAVAGGAAAIVNGGNPAPVLVKAATPTAHFFHAPNAGTAIWECELAVVYGSGSDPCVVINRVGTKDDGQWSAMDDNDICKKRSEEAVKRGDDDIYFECDDQKAYEKCTASYVMGDLSSNPTHCAIGTSDGYEVQYVGFQTEYVATPAVHNHGYSVESLKNHIETILDSENAISLKLAANREVIFGDERIVWDAFGDGFDRLGFRDANSFLGAVIAGLDENNYKCKSEWGDYLVLDKEKAPEDCTVNDPESFDEFNRVVLVDAPSIGGERSSGTVPIIVQGLGAGQYAITIEGPDHLGEGELPPRVDMRGWNVKMDGGQGLIKTVGYVDLVFRRTKILMPDDAEGLFVLSPQTRVNYDQSGGLTIKMVAEAGTPVVFAGTPPVDVIKALAENVTIEYTALPPDINLSPPIGIAGGSGIKTIDCSQGQCDSTLGDLLIFDTRTSPKNFLVSIEPYPIENRQGTFFAYSLSEDENIRGAEIIGLEPAADDEETQDVEQPPADDDGPADDAPTSNAAAEKNKGIEYSWSDSSEDAPQSCPAGQYWSKYFKECKPFASNAKSASGSESGLYIDTASPENSSGNSGADGIGGTPSNGDRVVGSDGGEDSDGGDDDSTEFAMNGSGASGCSMVPGAGPTSAAPLVFVAMALIMFAARRAE